MPDRARDGVLNLRSREHRPPRHRRKPRDLLDRLLPGREADAQQTTQSAASRSRDSDKWLPRLLPRLVQKSRDKTLLCGFNPAVSPSALKSTRAKIRELGVRHRAELSLAEIAYRLNPLLQGWINYYGRYAPSALAPLLR
jgi:hypothetical protein